MALRARVAHRPFIVHSDQWNPAKPSASCEFANCRLHRVSRGGRYWPNEAGRNVTSGSRLTHTCVIHTGHTCGLSRPSGNISRAIRSRYDLVDRSFLYFVSEASQANCQIISASLYIIRKSSNNYICYQFQISSSKIPLDKRGNGTQNHLIKFKYEESHL